MNKTDLVNELASILGTQKQAKEAVDCVLGSITEALANNDAVQISGFGSFRVSERKARTGRNPQTGAEIQIAARTVPKFVPGKALKDGGKVGDQLKDKKTAFDRGARITYLFGLSGITTFILAILTLSIG